MRQPGRGGRCRPRSPGAWPRDSPGAHRSVRVRVGRAGTRVAATGLGQVPRMPAVSCGYQEREVQPLLEFSDGVAETAVPMGAFCPARIANVAANAARAAAVARSRTGRQGRRRAPAGSLL